MSTEKQSSTFDTLNQTDKSTEYDAKYQQLRQEYSQKRKDYKQEDKKANELVHVNIAHHLLNFEYAYQNVPLIKFIFNNIKTNEELIAQEKQNLLILIIEKVSETIGEDSAKDTPKELLINKVKKMFEKNTLQEKLTQIKDLIEGIELKREYTFFDILADQQHLQELNRIVLKKLNSITKNLEKIIITNIVNAVILNQTQKINTFLVKEVLIMLFKFFNQNIPDEAIQVLDNIRDQHISNIAVLYNRDISILKNAIKGYEELLTEQQNIKNDIIKIANKHLPEDGKYDVNNLNHKTNIDLQNKNIEFLESTRDNLYKEMQNNKNEITDLKSAVEEKLKTILNGTKQNIQNELSKLQNNIKEAKETINNTDNEKLTQELTKNADEAIKFTINDTSKSNPKEKEIAEISEDIEENERYLIKEIAEISEGIEENERYLINVKTISNNLRNTIDNKKKEDKIKQLEQKFEENNQTIQTLKENITTLENKLDEYYKKSDETKSFKQNKEDQDAVLNELNNYQSATYSEKTDITGYYETEINKQSSLTQRANTYQNKLKETINDLIEKELKPTETKLNDLQIRYGEFASVRNYFKQKENLNRGKNSIEWIADWDKVENEIKQIKEKHNINAIEQLTTNVNGLVQKLSLLLWIAKTLQEGYISKEFQVRHNEQSQLNCDPMLFDYSLLFYSVITQQIQTSSDNFVTSITINNIEELEEEYQLTFNDKPNIIFPKQFVENNISKNRRSMMLRKDHNETKELDTIKNKLNEKADAYLKDAKKSHLGCTKIKKQFTGEALKIINNSQLSLQNKKLCIDYVCNLKIVHYHKYIKNKKETKNYQFFNSISCELQKQMATNQQANNRTNKIEETYLEETYRNTPYTLNL